MPDITAGQTSHQTSARRQVMPDDTPDVTSCQSSLLPGSTNYSRADAVYINYATVGTARPSGESTLHTNSIHNIPFPRVVYYKKHFTHKTRARHNTMFSNGDCIEELQTTSFSPPYVIFDSWNVQNPSNRPVFFTINCSYYVTTNRSHASTNVYSQVLVYTDQESDAKWRNKLYLREKQRQDD